MALSRPLETLSLGSRRMMQKETKGKQENDYRGTSLIRKRPPPPRTTIGPYAEAYSRVLGGGGFL